MFVFIIVLQVFFTFTSTVIGGNKERNKQIAESLIMGINSHNLGLRTSSAQMIGDLKLKDGVIPLLRMLKNDKSEDARIVAALSLLKIGDSRGIFALKQAIKFDESDRVRRVCSKFYKSITKNIFSSNLVALE